MKTAGLVLDHFDDPSFELLITALEGAEPPPMIKEAQLIAPDDALQLPDDAFALVLLNGGHKMRKFACIDQAHTALSCMYFHETRGSLPLEAQKTAAANLGSACEYFGLPVTDTMAKLARSPEEERKLMTEGRTGVQSVLDKRRKRAEEGGIGGWLAAKSVKALEKDVSSFDDALAKLPKTAEARYVDVTDTTLARMERTETPTLLDGRYPVGSPEQVKQAEAYFLDQGIRMDPRMRHEYCKGLVKAAGVYGIEKLAGVVQEYGATSYGRDLEACLEARCEFLPKEAIPVLQKLAAVAAVTPPEEFAEALADFDEKTGLSHYWGQHVIDPWLSTLGPPRDKVAEYVWSEGAERTTGSELMDLATNHVGLVKEQFGDDMASEFVKDPIVLFESMPGPHKKILARMANDKFSGGAECASGS